MKTRVVIADECAVSRLATHLTLRATGNFDVVGESGDGSDAVSLVEKHRPDVVLMELSLQGLDGLEAMLAMKEKVPGVKIIVLTSWDEDSDVVSAVSVGADGFCNMENSSNLVEAIQVVLTGGKWIDPKLRNHEPIRRILLSQDPTFSNNESIGPHKIRSQKIQESRFDC